MSKRKMEIKYDYPISLGFFVGFRLDLSKGKYDYHLTYFFLFHLNYHKR